MDKTVASCLSTGNAAHRDQPAQAADALPTGRHEPCTSPPDGWLRRARALVALRAGGHRPRFRPPFPALYVGSVRAYSTCGLGEIDERIAELEREKYLSTGVRWRTTATFRPCRSASAAVVAAGRFAGVRCAGRRTAREKRSCAAQLPLPGGRDPRGDRAYRRVAGGRAAETKKSWRKATKIS